MDSWRRKVKSVRLHTIPPRIYISLITFIIYYVRDNDNFFGVQQTWRLLAGTTSYASNMYKMYENKACTISKYPNLLAGDDFERSFSSKEI